MTEEHEVSNLDYLLLEIATCLLVKKGKKIKNVNIPLLYEKGVVKGEIYNKRVRAGSVEVDGEVLYDVTPIVSHAQDLLHRYIPFYTTFVVDDSRIVLKWSIIPT